MCLLAALALLHVSRLFFESINQIMNVVTKMRNKFSIPFEDVVMNEGDAVNVKFTYVRQLSSSALFGDSKEVVISHLGVNYSLAITKQKKLLLTKVR
jgi:hemin uptake protein HemP